jgi:hypothetical protein
MFTAKQSLIRSIRYAHIGSFMIVVVCTHFVRTNIEKSKQSNAKQLII